MPDLSIDGARVRAVPSGVVQRVVDGLRYAVTGVAPTNWFGPMQPLAPMAPADVAGRRFDYPTGYNLQYEPRAYEPVTFSDLRALADNCDILRLVIETRKDQIEAQDWDVRPKRQNDGDRPKSSAFASEIGFARSFFASPDREHDFASWTRQIAEEIQNVADRLVHLETQPGVPNLGPRLAECERAAKDYWKIKDKVLVWSLRVATAALLLGVGGGALFKALFEH